MWLMSSATFQTTFANLTRNESRLKKVSMPEKKKLQYLEDEVRRLKDRQKELELIIAGYEDN